MDQNVNPELRELDATTNKEKMISQTEKKSMLFRA